MNILTATILSFLIFFAMNGYWYLQKRRLRNYQKSLSNQVHAEFDAESYLAFNVINMVVLVLLYGMLIFNTVEALIISVSRFTLSSHRWELGLLLAFLIMLVIQLVFLIIKSRKVSKFIWNFLNQLPDKFDWQKCAKRIFLKSDNLLIRWIIVISNFDLVMYGFDNLRTQARCSCTSFFYYFIW